MGCQAGELEDLPSGVDLESKRGAEQGRLDHLLAICQGELAFPPTTTSFFCSCNLRNKCACGGAGGGDLQMFIELIVKC